MARIVKDLQLAIKHLNSGNILAYPTETFYGLGVCARNETALEKLSCFKQRDPKKPFPVLLPSKNSISEYAIDIPTLAKNLMDRHWPGALTLILKNKALPKSLENENGGVGFRVSSHPLTLELLQSLDQPITTTSANLSGGAAATTAQEVLDAFPKEARDDFMVLDGGQTPGGKASTIVDCSNPSSASLIREGVIAWAQLQKEMETHAKDSTD